jgi:hypothetical protein
VQFGHAAQDERWNVLVVRSSAGPTWGNLDDDALREHLVDAGRRTLGLRAPHRIA